MKLNDKITINTTASELVRAYAALSLFNGKDHQGFDNCLWNALDEMFPNANDAHTKFIEGKDKRDACNYSGYQEEFENFILGEQEIRKGKIQELEETINQAKQQIEELLKGGE